MYGSSLSFEGVKGHHLLMQQCTERNSQEASHANAAWRQVSANRRKSCHSSSSKRELLLAVPGGAETCQARSCQHAEHQT